MNHLRLRRLAAAVTIAASALTIAATAARATDGYFEEGVSPADQATGGAGGAEGRDALTRGNNPASLTDVGQQFNGDLTLFAPSRGYDATGTLFVAPGSHESSYDLFGVPALAYAQPTDGESSWGVALYGNGGMNTDYKVSSNPNCGGRTGRDARRSPRNPRHGDLHGGRTFRHVRKPRPRRLHPVRGGQSRFGQPWMTRDDFLQTIQQV